MKSALTVVLFRLFTIGVFVDGKEASNVSVMEGDSVTLKSGVTGVQTVDDIEWRFNGIRIDKFEDGLQLNSQTGDLKISNIRTEHSGLYKVKISSTTGSSVMEYNVKGVFVDGKEASNVSVMEGDSVTLKSGVTGVQTVDDIEWRFNGKRIDKFEDGLQLNSQTGDLKISNIRTKDSGLYKVKISSTTGSSVMEYNVKVVSADEETSVSVMEGDSVTLRTDDPDIQRVDVIRWRFGLQKSSVAEINRTDGIFNTYNGPDERFRDRLKLDQTGSLNITNINITDAGLYEAEISSTRSRYTIHHTRSFNVTVSDEVESVSVLMGDSVTLRTGLTEIQRDDEILWKFGDNDETIAPLKTWRNIDLNSMTGDLTISNIQRDQSGHYKVEIITRRMILHRKYQITIGDMKTVSGKEGGSVTLQIVTEIQSDDLIVWMFGNINLAEFNKTGPRFSTSDKRFKGKLDLDHQTGYLIIMNINPTHAGDYKLKIISSRHIINRKITVTVTVTDLSSVKKLPFKLNSKDAGIGSGVGVVLLLAAAVGVFYYLRWSSRNDMKKNMQKMPDKLSEEKPMI